MTGPTRRDVLAALALALLILAGTVVLIGSSPLLNGQGMGQRLSQSQR